jgi:putative addiction module killer protein
MDYTRSVIEICKSDTYERWFRKLKDRHAQARINARLRRIEESGYFGDVKPVRDGVSEIRIDHGPGYRIYFMRQGSRWVLLLAGGDKSTQDADIDAAIRIARDWRNRT